MIGEGVVGGSKAWWDIVKEIHTFLRMYLKCRAAAVRGMIRPSASRERSATIARKICQPR